MKKLLLLWFLSASAVAQVTPVIPGGTVYGNAGSSPAAPAAQPGIPAANLFFAQAYGQTGFGTTPCTWTSAGDVGPCINSAIAAAAANGGGSVRIPAGTFGVQTPISNGNSYVTLQGAGYNEAYNVASSHNYAGGTLLKWVGSAPVATFTGTLSGTSLTVSGVTGTILVNQLLSGTGIPAGTTIVSGSGTSWVVSGAGASVGPEAVTANSPLMYVGTPTGTNISYAGITGISFDCAATVLYCVYIQEVSNSLFNYAAANAATNGVVEMLTTNASGAGNGTQFNDFYLACGSNNNATCVLIDQPSGSNTDVSFSWFRKILCSRTAGDCIVQGAGDTNDFYSVVGYPNTVAAGAQPVAGTMMVMANTAYTPPNGVPVVSVNNTAAGSGQNKIWHTDMQVDVLGAQTGSVLTQTVGVSAALGNLATMTATAVIAKNTNVLTFSTGNPLTSGWTAGMGVTCTGNGASAGTASLALAPSGVIPGDPISVAPTSTTVTLQYPFIQKINNYPASTPSTTCVANYGLQSSAVAGTYTIVYSGTWAITAPGAGHTQSGIVATGTPGAVIFQDVVLALASAPSNGDTWTLIVPGSAGSLIAEDVDQGNNVTLPYFEPNTLGNARYVNQVIPNLPPGANYPVNCYITTQTNGCGFSWSGVVNSPNAVDGIVEFSQITCTQCLGGTKIIDYQVDNGSGFNSQFSVTNVGNASVSGSYTAAGSGNLNFNGRGYISSPAAGQIQLGQPNAATPINQTLSAQGARSGTDTNAAGGTLTIQPGASTGNATPPTITFNVPHVAGSGTAAQTQTQQLQLGDNAVTIGGASTQTTVSGTGAITLPYGSVAQRPSACVLGQTRLNTDYGAWEYCSTAGTPGTWRLTNGTVTLPGCSGGQISQTNVAITEQNLAVCKIPANAMGTVGQLRFSILWLRTVPTTDSVTWTLRSTLSSGAVSGGNLLWSQVNTTSGVTGLQQVMLVGNTTSAHQAVAFNSSAVGALTGTITAAPNDPTINTAVDQYYDVNCTTGTQSVSDTCGVYHWSVELITP